MILLRNGGESDGIGREAGKRKQISEIGSGSGGDGRVRTESGKQNSQIFHKLFKDCFRGISRKFHKKLRIFHEMMGNIDHYVFR